MKPKTVYGELMLSDQLVDQIDKLKSELDITQKRLKEKCTECEDLKSVASTSLKHK